MAISLVLHSIINITPNMAVVVAVVLASRLHLIHRQCNKLAVLDVALLRFRIVILRLYLAVVVIGVMAVCLLRP